MSSKILLSQSIDTLVEESIAYLLNQSTLVIAVLSIKVRFTVSILLVTDKSPFIVTRAEAEAYLKLESPPKEPNWLNWILVLAPPNILYNI